LFVFSKTLQHIYEYILTRHTSTDIILIKNVLSRVLMTLLKIRPNIPTIAIRGSKLT